MTDKATQVCKLLGISRVMLTGRHPEIRQDPRLAQLTSEVFAGGRAFFFGPRGQVLGLMTDTQFMERIHRCVAHIEAQRARRGTGQRRRRHRHVHV